MKLFQNVGWLAVLVGFVSCAGLKQPKPEIQYYTLEYTSPQISASEPVSALIRFEPFEATAPYHSDRMIYREGAFKRDAYFYYFHHFLYRTTGSGHILDNQDFFSFFYLKTSS